MLRILLVDDLALVRHGLRMRLELEPDITVVGEAGDGESALTLVATQHPDVVVMDLAMPGMDGFKATAALRKLRQAPRVVVHSIHDDQASQARAFAAGAFAYVDKGASMEHLLAAIRGTATIS